ncbi:hypothetical protein ABPG75_004836 [Micractinium tetrahymenae]
MQPGYSPEKYLPGPSRAASGPGGAPASSAASTPNDMSEFTWQRAARPAPAPDHAVRLAAAAELARRCAELGVRPPLRPLPPAQSSAPAPVQQPQAAPQPAPAPQAGRLEALVEHVQQASSALATAVQGQSQQLAVQQQLLTDVVQGLLFVGAKAGAGTRPAAGPAAGGQAQKHMRAATATPARQAGAGSTVQTPRRTAAAVQQKTAQPSLSPSHVGRRRGSGDEPAPWAASASPTPGSEHGHAGTPASPPCGMLRVPVLMPAPEGRHSGLSSPREQEAGSPAGTQRPQAAAQGPQPAQPADDRSAAVEALLARRRGSIHATGRGSGSSRQQPHSRPAWDDCTVAQPGPRSQNRLDLAGPPPGRRLVGGVGPQLLLQELRRLQRRRTIAGSGVSRGPRRSEQQAPRPLTAPAAAAGRARPAPGAGGPGRERRLHSKQSAAVGGRGRMKAEAVPAETPPLPRPIQLQPCHRAAAASRAAEREAVATAGPAAAGRQGRKQTLPQQQVQLPPKEQPAAASSSTTEAGDEPAVHWEQLTAEDVNAVCDSICRRLLLSECAPCAAAVPVC